MKISGAFYNWISITGFIIVFNSLILMLFLHLSGLFYTEHSSYPDLYNYVILPLSLVIGIILIITGMYIQVKKQEQLSEKQHRLPVIDFNDKSHRYIVVKIAAISMIFLAASFIGSYKAYQYTSTPRFCGELCHKVMEPEYTTYLNSSHARVSCVGCHSGEGAGWFVQSRLAVMEMASSLAFGKYSKPIPANTGSLRPDRRTCENCHWPQKFYTRKLVNKVSYLSDSANTEWDISLMLKVGPKTTAQGLKEGIHWHINPDVRIEYIASDPGKEEIPWVRYSNLKTGTVKVFSDRRLRKPLTTAMLLNPKLMDCMDCHNRPSHLFLYPSDYIDQAINAGKIPESLPYIRKAAMTALCNPYQNSDSAMKCIARDIRGFYQGLYPEIYSGYKQQIDKAIQSILLEYSKNTFPEMHVDASSYPNHIGHLETQGCFRCHSGYHTTSNGESIPSDCNLCHSIIEQGPAKQLQFTAQNDTMSFIHPVPIKASSRNKACSECHHSLYN